VKNIKIIKIKFLLASVKTVTNCENPFSNPLQEACSCFPKAAGDFKSCSKSQPVILKRVLQSTESAFVEAAETLYLFFSLIRQGEIKKTVVHVQKVLIYFLLVFKKYLSGDLILLTRLSH
jgi:hypothetical protein